MFGGQLIVLIVLMKMSIIVHVSMVILMVGMVTVIKTVLKENGNVLMILIVFLIIGFVMETITKVIK
jgi:hypothetical protein